MLLHIDLVKYMPLHKNAVYNEIHDVIAYPSKSKINPKDECAIYHVIHDVSAYRL